MFGSNREGENLWTYAVCDRQSLRVESGIKIASRKKWNVLIEMVKIEICSFSPEVFLTLSICLNRLHLGWSVKVSKVDSPWLGSNMYRTDTRATRNKIIDKRPDVRSNYEPHPGMGMTKGTRKIDLESRFKVMM